MADLHRNQEHWRMAAEILDHAAGIIEERGWHQGERRDARAECAASAIELAFKEAKAGIVDFFYVQDALLCQLELRQPIPGDIPEGGPDVSYWGRPVMEWNDEKRRTAEEVVNGLKMAAERARAAAASKTS